MSSEKIWSMPRGNLAPGHRDTSSSSDELPITMESRAKVEPVSGKHGVTVTFRKRPKSRSLLEDENNEGFLQKMCWYSRAQSGRIGDLIIQRITKFPMRTVNRGTQSSICRGGTRLGNPVDTIIPVQNKNFPGDPEEPDEVPGADEATKSHLH